MKIHHATKHKIRLDSEDYFADNDGIIEIPDNKVNSSIWSQGFTVVNNRLTEIEKSVNEVVTPVAIPIKQKKTTVVKTSVAVELDKPLLN